MNFQVSPEEIIAFLYVLYRTIRSLIQYIFENTIMKTEGALATQFADAATMLITISAILLILEAFSAARKILRTIVILGWALLILSIIANVLA